MTPSHRDQPTRVLPSTAEQPAPTTEAPPPARFWRQRVPSRIGRARTSTVILGVLFVALFSLYLAVRPTVAYTTVVTETGETYRLPVTDLVPSTEPTAPVVPAAPTSEVPEPGTPTGTTPATPAPATTTTPRSTSSEPAEEDETTQPAPTTSRAPTSSRSPASDRAPATSVAPETGSGAEQDETSSPTG